MSEVIRLYHCSSCDYEAGTKNAVRRHIAKEHDKELLFLCEGNLEVMYGLQVARDKAVDELNQTGGTK